MQVDQISADQNGLMNYKEHWAVARKRIIANLTSCYWVRQPLKHI